ncbi:probable 3-hydroxyisobutyrate dehydrogenase, mitochondrial isoform X10 [Phoenix dactylifera]|uniref:3-hydroxyisobutyrate dehydrogenase n=1 Tax=Phoenix dactylifera TaxID=42345 RepID=A0A8B8ZJ62_PHODC|nr:probable 3-hydroxyisobutyrate dehydrogenase, mitochondrial isoform X10 [Phoenix dactylifera]
MAIASRLRARGVLSRCESSNLRSLLWPFLNRGFSSSSIPFHLERVGFIGLGNMGFHMASNLITAGYKITVHDINYDALKKFSDKGIPTKETPCEVAESSDVIITMLPSSSNVLDVYTGQNGLLHCRSHLSPWLFIDSSTIDPQTSRILSTNISKCLLKEKKGFADNPLMLDAPVSGGVPAAEAGTLTFMVGGLEEAYLAAKPLFLSMGKQTIYCGSSGNGAAKDLTLAMTSAGEIGLKCPLTSEARDIYMELCAKGYDSKDFSCVFRHFYSAYLNAKVGTTCACSDGIIPHHLDMSAWIDFGWSRLLTGKIGVGLKEMGIIVINPF